MLKIEEKPLKKMKHLELFQELMEIFRSITDFNYSFVPVDKRYSMLKPSGEINRETDFCKIVQSDPEGKRRCCDERRLIGIMSRTRKPYIETCHAGLIDVFIPIFIESKFIGYFCFGKFLFESPCEEHYREVLDKTADLEIDREKLGKAYFSTRVLTRDYIDLLTQIFTPIACKMIEMEVDILEEKRKVEKLSSLLFNRHFSDEIIGRSDKMRNVFEYLGKINKSDGCVYIYGESGTGKELLAKYIHLNSRRKDQPFLTVNCASLSDQILESELFGHVRGAFSGAVKDRIGILETVNGGTLCLDEIGETSQAFQKRLLRVIEEKEIKPVGSDIIKKINVRFIASTNKDPLQLVAEGKFREDLYYRLSVFNVTIPPLRERPEDIPLLIDYFYRLRGEKYGEKQLSFTRKAMEKLMKYEWPGNIRELRNFVENLYFLVEGQVNVSLVLSYLEGEVDQHSTGSEFEIDDYESALAEFERKLFLRKLEKYDWNISATAKALGRTREWLSRKISALKLKELSVS
ncbi:MAG: sigma 54-interacting transcriptional regulator [Candidatus Glassbacteria bacterium]|nr:sigma 54-interacting transcriptional regulator [Candidatus Glassbacteria bacterium]